MTRMILMVLCMALVTYIIRMIPITFFRKKIRSKYLYSLFYYIPYAVLSAMTFPYIFFATGNLVAGIVGTVCAIVAAISKRSLIIVALIACSSALIVNLIYLI